MSKIEGACLCGDVRYTTTATPVVVALCHCTHCQCQSGAAYSINVGVRRGTLTFTAAQPPVYTDIGSSGQPVYRYFCGRCGSPIFSDVASRLTLDWVKA